MTAPAVSLLSALRRRPWLILVGRIAAVLPTGVAHAAVPVSDVPRLGAETTTRSATTDTLSTGRQTNTSRHAISCSMHRSGKGPQGAAANNPEITSAIHTQAVQTKMVVRHLQGEPLEKTLAWAESEVEGFLRG